MSAALELKGLRKAYGKRQALDGLDLTVPAGSILGLIGANGAGKTTMMSICCGLLKPDAGDVKILGGGAFDPVAHAGRVSILPQDSRLPLHARVADLLHFYGRLQDLPRARLDREVGELLAWVNLADRAKSSVKSLSHGMMRRLTVAQAFIGDPELIFLDEPMSGLDPREVTRMRERLRERRGRQTIVISSHVLTELEQLCDHIAFVDHGKLVRQDTLAAIVKQHHRMLYRIAPGGTAPLEAVRAAVPGLWELSADGTELSAVLEEGAGSPDAINARIIPVLLGANCGIVEIRRGSDLETEFLAATG